MNIKHHIENILPVFNSRKPLIFAEVAKKNFHISFMREGQTKKLPTAAVRRGLLDYANDWKIQVDFKNKSTVFPPVICATSQRPDVVLWSVLSRTVILLELTCPAEEGIAAAQIRKGERYSELVKQINDTKIWKARLLTIEAGARGLIASSTYRAFRVLGFSPVKSSRQRLSEVVVRCSYAIYLAHNTPVWTHNEDLISTNSPLSFPVTATTPNIVVLREHGIRSLYHFTDRANLNSIRENGLVSAGVLIDYSLPSMNSDEISRKIDAKSGLKDYVRLSFCSNNPMMHAAKKAGRVHDPVVLRIKLEAVSRPGVLFSDCNAIRHDANISEQPEVVRFEIVKTKSVFLVPELLRHFYQAEVLIPSPVPPHLISFPSSRSRKQVQLTY